MLNRTSQNWPTDTAHKLPASSPAPARWIVSLDKYRATWNYFTTNPSGGGFGSHYCGPKALHRIKRWPTFRRAI